MIASRKAVFRLFSLAEWVPVLSISQSLTVLYLVVTEYIIAAHSRCIMINELSLLRLFLTTFIKLAK